MKKLLFSLFSALQGGVRGGLLFFVLVINTTLRAENFEVKWGNNVLTVAEVRALADDTETKTVGVVNFISGKNVYIQDATAGILVYTTETPNCKVGDRIVVKGKKVIYGGAPEVSGAVIESVEAASVTAPTVFETLVPLLADSLEHRYFATRVTIPGVIIVEYDSYNNPTVQDAAGNKALCYKMVLDPATYPVRSRVNVTGVAAWFYGFQFVGDAAGIDNLGVLTANITVQSSNTAMGIVSGSGFYDLGDYAEISAIANYGYHFTKWSDDYTNNPRIVKVTSDKTYTANFEKNIYAITKQYDAQQGSISGPTAGKYLDVITLTAVPKTGYRFTQWHDGVTTKSRDFELTKDTTFTAFFTINQYSITTTSSHSDRGTTQGDTTVNYLENVTISATANYGYHFAQWNDGNTENPRVVQVTDNKNYTAQFDKNRYKITTYCDNQKGSVSAPENAEYLDQVTISATANHGYHFTQWSDGNTDNPCTLVLTQDTTFTAEFAINQYSITTTSSHSERGTAQGDTTVNYLENVTISATANYGYHFAQWNDGNTENPRVVQVTDNKNYTAQFDKNIYSITTGCNNNQMGSVSAPDSAEYLDELTLTATHNYGYQFVGWSDGNTDNPRTLILTQDTTFIAEFAQFFSGQCGNNLYWIYDETTKVLSITGFGEMCDYTQSTQPWLLFQEQITEVTISNAISSIGTSAFEGCVRLSKVSLGYGMENIAANAFAECNRLYDIYSYATYPPFAEESSFANYNVYVYIPCEYQRDYILDVVWGKFKFIECIGAESDDMGGNDILVTPGTNDVTITWPTDNNADTYSIVITKDGEVFCTLTFNSNGQLVSIAFAPGREGNHPAQYAEATTKGYRFTVTGLEESTKYAYNIDVKDAANKTIQSYSGEFTTKSATGVEDVVINDGTSQKLLRDGQLLIIRDGKTYNAQGAEL